MFRASPLSCVKTIAPMLDFGTNIACFPFEVRTKTPASSSSISLSCAERPGKTDESLEKVTVTSTGRPPIYSIREDKLMLHRQRRRLVLEICRAATCDDFVLMS